jgi:molybdopterin/thiamine biosynthesis adenylyltransferase
MGPDELSRPKAAAAGLGDDDHRFTEKRVLLRGEEDVLNTPNGREIFRAALLLLVRICENVSIAIPHGCEKLRADIVELILQYFPTRAPRFSDQTDCARDFDAVLSIGRQGRADAPWTVVNSDGWIARVSSCGRHLDLGANRENAIGAVGAACFGVSEVFKRLITLKPSRGVFLDAVTFSFWTYREELRDDGPEVRAFDVDVMLIGCGAIGSGTAYILSRLPISGRAVALDPQTYRSENFGTSIILRETDYNRPKVEVVSELLCNKLKTVPLPFDIATLKPRFGGELPDIILSGLDEVNPRHEVQQLWPSIVIDGATGADHSCQVSCHPWSGPAACLLCVFQKPRVTSLAELNARATGLPNEIANDPEAVVTERIIVEADEQKRPWLRNHLGKRICSITSEAVLKLLSDEKQKEGFAPATPFVACFSSCMIVTELLRYLWTGRPSRNRGFNSIYFGGLDVAYFTTKIVVRPVFALNESATSRACANKGATQAWAPKRSRWPPQPQRIWRAANNSLCRPFFESLIRSVAFN